MDMRINIGATPPPPVFTGKNEAVSRDKEAASLDNRKEASSVGFAGKSGDAKDVIEEVQEVLREALSIDPIPRRELLISFEEELDRIVFKVLDKDSGELVRQVPLPEQIAIAKDLRAVMERMALDQSGIVVNQEV